MHWARAQGAVVQDAVVYVATYVEVMPASAMDGATLLTAFGAAIRKEDGNLRAEIVQEINRPNRFVILAAWRDQKAIEGHIAAVHTRTFRVKISPMAGSPYDDRLYKALE